MLVCVCVCVGELSNCTVNHYLPLILTVMTFILMKYHLKQCVIAVTSHTRVTHMHMPHVQACNYGKAEVPDFM